jgi:hypothetical protein
VKNLDPQLLTMAPDARQCRKGKQKPETTPRYYCAEVGDIAVAHYCARPTEGERRFPSRNSTPDPVAIVPPRHGWRNDDG